jgi:zinc transporter, ZIP family
VHVDALSVFIAALVTALATGLGAAPFFAARTVSRRWLGLANACAAGFMLSASGVLAWEGGRRGAWRLVGGIALGCALIVATRRALRAHGEFRFGGLGGVDARKAVAIIVVMTIHSLTEGAGVGVSFGGGSELGVFITAAIAIHNIPEGLAISLVLVPRGARPISAAWWSVFSSLPQPLLAVPAFLFVEAFRPWLPVGFGFAAGAMAWLVFSELVPDALSETPRRPVAAVVTAALVAMTALQLLLLRA